MATVRELRATHEEHKAAVARLEGALEQRRRAVAEQAEAAQREFGVSTIEELRELHARLSAELEQAVAREEQAVRAFTEALR